MEQFVFVPASLYNSNNKSLSSQTVAMQELPKYGAEQNSTYQIDSLRKEINKKLFAKADFQSTKFCLVLVSSFQNRRL